MASPRLLFIRRDCKRFPPLNSRPRSGVPPRSPRPHALSKNIILARTLSSASASSRKPSPRDYIAGRLCSLYSKELSLSENLLNDDDAGMTSSIRIHRGFFLEQFFRSLKDNFSFFRNVHKRRLFKRSKKTFGHFWKRRSLLQESRFYLVD